MKKTVSINLNNQVFVIEEVGYEKLNNYLEQIKNHCGGDVDVNEVIKDIEASMAEKLKANLNEYKQVVTEADVDELIKVMGTIEEFARESGENNSTEENSKRRLYRDSDNAIIAGVASGLSNYFDIDPVIIRVLFAASLFAGGFGFILYVILWLAMPEAKTAQQKMEMHGQTPTLAAFENIAKSSKDMAEKWRASSGYKKVINFPFLVAKQVFAVIKKIFGKLLFLLRICCGIFLLGFSLLIIGLVGVGFVFLLLQDHSLYSISNIPVADVVKVMPLTWLALSGFLSVTIPLLFLFFAGLLLIRRKATLNFVSLMVMLALWMFSGVVFVGTTLRYVPEVQTVFKNHVNNQIAEKILVDNQPINNIILTGSDLNVEVEFVEESGVKLVGKNGDLNKIEAKFEAESLLVSNNQRDINDFCINCSQQEIKLLINEKYKNEINIENKADVNFTKGEVDNLKLNINNNADVMLTNIKVKSATINLSDRSELIAKGNFENMLIVANESNVNCQKCNLGSLSLTATDSLVKVSGEANEFVYKGNAIEYDNILNLTKSSIKKSQLETTGESFIILDDQQDVKYALSEKTKIFIEDGVKLSQLINEMNVTRYKNIDQQEYYKLIEKGGLDDDLLSVDGVYYHLVKTDSNKDKFEQTKHDFINLID